MGLIYPPTGMTKIRLTDSHGAGHFRARRKERLHGGVDFEGVSYQQCYAPITGIITRMSRPYGNSESYDVGYIIANNDIELQVFYVKIDEEAVHSSVIQGQKLGTLCSLTIKYPGITTHAHLKVNYINPTLLI